jgi:hypothetical protein
MVFWLGRGAAGAYDGCPGALPPAARWAGVVPQQPPTTLMPFFSTNSHRLGKRLRLQRINRLAIHVQRQPALGMQDTGRWRFRPGNGSARACAPARWSSSGRSHRWAGLPGWSGQRRYRCPAASARWYPGSPGPELAGGSHPFLESLLDAGMAAFTSRISCEVSIRSRSTPPWIRPDSLLAEDLCQLVEGDIRQSQGHRRGQLARGTDRAGDKARLLGRAEYSSARRRARRRPPG